MLHLIDFCLTIIFKIFIINSKYKIKKYFLIKNLKNFYYYCDDFYISYNAYYIFFNTTLLSTYFLCDLLSCEIATNIG